MALIANAGQDSYKSDLETTFETLQEQRSTLLDMTSALQLSRRLLTLQEARRISATAGAADPRVAAYTASSGAMVQRVAALQVETQIARIRVPVLTRTETLLQGRVTDSDARALAQVQVTLVDETGAPVRGVEPAETDDSGYYAFVLEPAQVKAIGTDRKLTLQVGANACRLVPASLKPFSLAAGQVTVSEAQLQDSELGQLGLRAVFTATPRPVNVGSVVADTPARVRKPIAEAAPPPATAPAARSAKPAAAAKAKAAGPARKPPARKR